MEGFSFYLQEGIDLCKEGNFLQAHQILHKAYKLNPDNPELLSWLGYTTAKVEHNLTLAKSLCEKAIESSLSLSAYNYRNLGVIYLMLRNRQKAVSAFSKGLQIDPENRSILDEWKAIGIRGGAVIPFLERKHWLNKFLGRLKSKVIKKATAA